MIRRPDHPMLHGLRFFAVCDNTSRLAKKDSQGGAAGVVTSCTKRVGGLGPLMVPALTFNGTTSVVTWGAFNNYWRGSKNITVITRCKSRVSQLKGVVASRNGSTAGWQILFSNSGSSEQGYNFAVFSSGGKFMEAQDGFTAAQQAGKDVVVAGVYDEKAHEVSLYTRQPTDPFAIFRHTHTNTTSANTATESWDVRSTNPLLFGSLNGISLFFDGDISWVAIFDRVLTYGEIKDWSRDEDWPFLEDYPAFSNVLSKTFSNEMNVGVAEGLEGIGARTFSTAVDAEAYVGGDLVGGPGGGSTRTYQTTVGVRSREVHGVPVLKQYVTTVGVAGTTQRTQTRTYRTRVGVRQGGSQRINGRKDLLNTLHYHR